MKQRQLLELLEDRVVTIKKDELYLMEKSNYNSLKNDGNFQLKKGDKIIFLRTNDWDRSYFSLTTGAEFKIWMGNPHKEVGIMYKEIPIPKGYEIKGDGYGNRVALKKWTWE